MLKFIKKNIKSFILLIFMAAVVYWGYTIYQHHKQLENRGVPMVVASAVQAAAPQGQDITVAKSYIGRVDAINEVDVVPYISGYISQIKVSGGQDVKKDDILLIIQQDEYQAKLMSSMAGIFSARADLENARSQYERMQKAGPKAVSQTEMDNAKASFLTAQAALKKAEADYFTAQVNYNYTILRAPFDGVLGNISPSIGDFIAPTSGAIMKIVQYSPIRVVFSLTDKEFLSNNRQDSPLSKEKVRLLLPNGSEYVETGKIKYTANEFDESTNSVAVYAEFANPQKQLVPNGYVKVMLEREYKDVVVLDKSLVILKNDGNYAYMVSNGILELNKVDVLADDKNGYVLANTFKDGQLLVMETVDARLLGQKVDVKAEK